MCVSLHGSCDSVLCHCLLGVYPQTVEGIQTEDAFSTNSRQNAHVYVV